jgi:hypothetical protein
MNCTNLHKLLTSPPRLLVSFQRSRYDLWLAGVIQTLQEKKSLTFAGIIDGSKGKTVHLGGEDD